MTRVLVTGGGTGIGRAIAQSFAASGQDVSIAGRRKEPLEDTARAGNIAIRLADITDEAQVAALFDQPYDIVIANAGAGAGTRVVDTSLEDWERTLRVNLTGTFLTFREALKSMQSGGRLIAIASTASLQGGANIAAYSAAKHGVLGLVRSLAQEVARKGITCNAVCPGFVDTEIADEAVRNVMAHLNIDRDAATARLVARNPMRRMIDPAEVVAAVRFLASAEATMVNGHALSVSGGEI